MSRIAYVNGRYVPFAEASVHIEDRGYQFADGVYEVVARIQGRMIDEAPHLDRLERSLSALKIPMPMSRAALMKVLREVLRRNRLNDAMVYIQVTRGVARRDHPFPAKAPAPGLVITGRRLKPMDPKLLEEGVGVVTLPDIRWRRCDIKSVSLLPNILAKQQAREQGAYEAWQVDSQGFVTEGASTNAWIVTRDGVIVTHPADAAILNGITRASLLAEARRAGFAVEERPFTVAEAKAAKEAFLTASTQFVLPVVRIDGQTVGNGQPGEITLRLRALYVDQVAQRERA